MWPSNCSAADGRDGTSHDGSRGTNHAAAPPQLPTIGPTSGRTGPEHPDGAISKEQQSPMK